MSNLLFFEAGVQGTSLGDIRPNQLVTGGSFQPSSQACILDITPPTFAGITYLTLGALGQLQMQWVAATDTSAPVRYEIYVQANSFVNLFNTINIAKVTTNLNDTVFTLANGSLLQPAVNYYVGVRAVDAVGNRDNNTISLAQISPGITGAVSNVISGVFNINTLNQLIGTFWVTDSLGTISNPARLGPGEYEIYDKTGAIVAGMAQSGIIADSEGFFEITPIASVLDLDNNFYAVKVTIPIDGIPVSYNLPIVSTAAGYIYEPRAVFSINAANQLQGTIWCVKNGQLLSTNLGTASFTIYDKDGVSTGITQSGITADANGYYDITSVSAALITDLTHYIVKLVIIAENDTRVGSVAITLGE